jgi:hypothetical protein
MWLAARYWPTFARTTPAIKSYIYVRLVRVPPRYAVARMPSQTIILTFGAVIHSDHALVEHQMGQRTGDLRHWRREATEAIQARGEFPSEGRVFREMELLRAQAERGPSS